MGGELHEIGVDNLRCAIVEQAANDYIDLLAGFAVPTTECNVSELLKFFRSDWYGMLCKIDPEYLIENLERKAKKMVLKYTISKEKGSHRFYVHTVDDPAPIPGTYGNKKQALHKAAKLNDLDFKDYMRVRRRDGVKVD
jgi:hypothetical protein